MNKSWPTKKLGEIISFEKGRKMAIASVGEPYIGIDGLRTNQYTVHTQEKKGVRCKPDDVLLVWDGAHAGTVGTGLSGFVGSTIVKILHDNSLENRFLFYLLKFFQEKIRAAAQGAAIPHLNKTFINILKIPLPPLKIQKQIVERLDAIKKAQELNDRQIKLAEELFQSSLHHELDPKGKNWGIRKLEALIQTQYGYTTSAKDKGNYRFVRITDIDDDGTLKQNDKKYISVKLGEIKEYILNKGDLLLARTGSIGKILYFNSDEPSIFASYLIRLSLDNSKIISKYLWLFSHTLDYWRQVKLFAGGAVQPQFNANSIKRIKIPLLPLEVQKQIVEKLSAVQEYKKKLIEQKQKLKELFESCLNKAMKGELVT